MILCADIGGTNTRLALASIQADASVRLLASWRVAAREVGSLSVAVARFLAQQQLVLAAEGGRVQAACFGVAGPVTGRRVQMTNLPWCIDADELSQQLGGVPTRLINDFHAAARGTEAVPPGQLLTLQSGDDVRIDTGALASGHQLVIGAGTGLGVAWRVWDGHRHLVVPGEGGHVGFAPLNAVQDRCLSRLRPQLGRVVAEHLVSGPGIVNLHRCLQAETGVPQDASVSAQDVFRRASQGGDPVARTRPAARRGATASRPSAGSRRCRRG